MNVEKHDLNMKRRMIKIDWLAPVLGLILVGGGYAATKTYLELDEKIRSGEQFIATLDGLMEDCNLNRLQMQAQNSGCASTASNLDELLSARIVRVNSELESADPRTRAFVGFCYNHIARLRSRSSPDRAGLPTSLSGREIAGQTGPAQEGLASAASGK
jgi:hypothetical protein